MDDATSEIYSAFLVEEEGTASTFRALKQVFTDKGMPSSLYTDRGSHYFHTPEAGGKVAKDQHTQVGRALHRLGIEHIAAFRPTSAPSAPSRPPRKELALAGIATVEAADRFIAGRPQPPLRRARRQRLRAPRTPRPERHRTDRTVARDNTVRYERRVLRSPPPQPASRPGSGSTSIQTEPSPSSTGPDASPATPPTASPSKPQPGRPRETLHATGRRPVDKWTAAPRLTTSPQGQPQQQKRTYDVLPKPDKYTC